jgi:hypothetical protein
MNDEYSMGGDAPVYQPVRPQAPDCVMAGPPTIFKRVAGGLMFRTSGPHYESAGVRHVWRRWYWEPGAYRKSLRGRLCGWAAHRALLLLLVAGFVCGVVLYELIAHV